MVELAAVLVLVVAGFGAWQLGRRAIADITIARRLWKQQAGKEQERKREAEERMLAVLRVVIKYWRKLIGAIAWFMGHGDG